MTNEVMTEMYDDKCRMYDEKERVRFFSVCVVYVFCR